MSLDGSYRKLAEANLRRIERYVSRLKKLLNDATSRFITLSSSVDYDPKYGQFYFDDYPELKKEVEKIVSELALGMERIIVSGTTAEWTQGTKDASGITEYLMKRAGLPVDDDSLKGSMVSRKLNNHTAALLAFQKRQIGGMTLSGRVWDLSRRSKIESELARSIAEGTSAAEIAESMQELLNNPGNLFRRVRDEFGTLHLSKNARAYNPGEGVYRSSFKNAMRLARTEINMAYRNAELESYREDPDVVGYEVKRSNNPYDCPICEALKGRYPKTFKWSGWHPQCRCYIVPILLTEKEFLRSLRDDDFDPATSENYVSETPRGFSDWMEANRERLSGREHLPYFVADNPDFVGMFI